MNQKVFAENIENPGVQELKGFACTKGWWAARIKQFAKNMDDLEGLASCKDAILNDFTAWIIFVALLMTVDFAALLVAPSNYHDNSNKSLVDVLMYLYVASFSVAAVASLSACYAGIQGYNFFNGIPVKMLDIAIESGRDMAQPVHYGSVAGTATMIGVTIGIYLLFGYIPLIIAASIFGLGVIEHYRILLSAGRSLNRIPGLTLAEAMT